MVTNEDPQFPAFAVCRIRGAILDELRRLVGVLVIHASKPRLNDITRDLMKQLGKQPTEAEIHTLGLIVRIINCVYKPVCQVKCKANC